MAQDQPTIAVTGVGRATATPDVVSIGLVVSVTSATPAEALQGISQRASSLSSALASHGVDEADRQTTDLSVQPAYEPRTGQPSGRHDALHELRVVVQDLDVAGRVLQAAAEALGDALRVRQLSLSVRDTTSLLATARRAAVEAARSQAEQLAAAAGVGLGQLVDLAEGGPPAGVRRMGPAVAVPSPPGSGPSLESGTYEVVVVVTATYAIAP